MNPDFLILYVADPVASAAFYSGLLGHPVVESAPTFAMVPLNGQAMLGLWRADGVQPAANAAGGMEIAVTVETPARVDECWGDWSSRGVTMLADPFDLDFGRSFVAADPDGHRLRVFSPRAGQ